MTIDSKVVDAIATGYYGDRFARPAQIRARAQVAYTVVSGVMVAMVAAGRVLDFESQRILVKAAGVLALLVWFATAFRFVLIGQSTSTERGEPERGGHGSAAPGDADQGQVIVTDAEDFAREAFLRAEATAYQLDTALDSATRMSLLAVALTVSAFLLGSFLPARGANGTAAVVTVSEKFRGQLPDDCGARLEGRLSIESLGRPFIEISPIKASCKPIGGDRLAIPSGEVLLVEATGAEWPG